MTGLLLTLITIGVVVVFALAVAHLSPSVGGEVEDPELSKSREVAEDIAEHFLHGDLYDRDVDIHGISELSIWWNNELVRVSFYDGSLGYRIRTILIGGENCLPDADCDIIWRAAVARAKRLALEDLERLHSRMKPDDLEVSQ